MNIVLFTHPEFLGSESMPRFARMLASAFCQRGHQVQLWSPKPKVYHWVPRGRLSKWAGYIDQYLVFPVWVRAQLAKQSPTTLFVFCDQALGPWVSLVADRPHIVHVHDLLALKSALGKVPENPTSLTGRIYQRYIRFGFRQARNFISISGQTRTDLHQFGHVAPALSEVVYNGLNYPYAPNSGAREQILKAGLPDTQGGILLHVGGGQWYKNTAGVIAIYAEYVRHTRKPLPLWCVSPPPGAGLLARLADIPAPGKVRFFQGLDNATLEAVYSVARVFLFPSLAEGFGWPLIEAQACGCPVMTTDAAPMNEIGGPAVRYLPQLKDGAALQAWAAVGAQTLTALLAMPPEQRSQLVQQGLDHAATFNAQDAIDGYLRIYQQVLDNTSAPHKP